MGRSSPTNAGDAGRIAPSSSSEGGGGGGRTGFEGFTRLVFSGDNDDFGFAFGFDFALGGLRTSVALSADDADLFFAVFDGVFFGGEDRLAAVAGAAFFSATDFAGEGAD